MFVVNEITKTDDIEQLVTEINQSAWDDANEMSHYDVESLSAYLNRQDTIFLACHDTESTPPTLLGLASSRLEIKPYGKELWLYVDEVDVCADQRRKGVGTMLMAKFMEIAKEKGCEEIWLGAEAENAAADALYRSLKPNHIADVIGYTYAVEKKGDGGINF